MQGEWALLLFDDAATAGAASAEAAALALLACARAQHAACSTTKQHNSTARITQK